MPEFLKGLGLVVATGLFLSASAYGQNSGTSILSLDNESKSSRRWSGEYSLDIGGVTFNEDKDSAAGAYVFVRSKFDYKMADWMRARLAPRIRFYSARVQERYDDDTLENDISLSDGYLSFEPAKFITIQAGALSQETVGQPMLISNLRSFPGLRQRLTWAQGDYFAEIEAQQLIPTSHSLNTEREQAEALPSFQTQALKFKGRTLDIFEWKASAGLFQWRDMPAKVAYESRRLGNEGYGDLVPESGLRFEHRGWFTGLTLCYCTPYMLNLIGEYQRVQNTEAPEDSSDAQMIGFGPRLDFGRHELDIRYRDFFIESDATVAKYNRSRFGHTNRIGNNVEVALKFKDYGFSIYGEMYKADVINPRNTEQRDMNEFFFGVETDYASF